MDAPKAGVALHHGQHHDERSNGGEAAGCIACNQERVLNYQAVKDPGEGGQDNEGCCRSQGDERGWSCWELPILSPYSPPSPSANTWERIERAQVTDPLAREHGRKRGCVEGVGGEDAGNGSTDAEQVDSHPSSRKQPEVLAAATQIRASADLGSIPLKYPPVHRRPHGRIGRSLSIRDASIAAHRPCESALHTHQPECTTRAFVQRRRNPAFRVTGASRDRPPTRRSLA